LFYDGMKEEGPSVESICQVIFGVDCVTKDIKQPCKNIFALINFNDDAVISEFIVKGWVAL